MKQIVRFTVTLLLFCTTIARAQTDTSKNCLSISGEIPQPLQLYAADLAAMKQSSIKLKDKKGIAHTYSGAALTDILQRAGVWDAGHKAIVGKYLLVTCADGYKVLFSLGELNPAFTSKKIILAVKMDGKPLPHEMGQRRIIVEGEKKMARSCYQVMAFTISSAKE